MPSISKGAKEGARKALKYALPAATLAAIAAQTGVDDVENISDVFRIALEKAKVGAAAGAGALGLGALSGAVQAESENRAIADRFKKAQKAVLAENDLLTLQTDRGNTYIGVPAKRDFGAKTEALYTLASAGVQSINDLGSIASSAASKAPVIGPALATVAGTAGTLAGATIRGKAQSATTKAAQALPFLSSSGYRQNHNMSMDEKASYCIEVDEENVSDLYRTLKIDSDPALAEERIRDFLGPELYHSLDFSIVGAVGGLTSVGASVVKGLSKSGAKALKGSDKAMKFGDTVKSAIPFVGRKASQRMVASTGKGLSNFGDKVSTTIRKGFEKVDPERGEKYANTVQGWAQTGAEFLDDASRSPKTAKRIVNAATTGQMGSAAIMTATADSPKKKDSETEVSNTKPDPNKG